MVRLVSSGVVGLGFLCGSGVEVGVMVWCVAIGRCVMAIGRCVMAMGKGVAVLGFGTDLAVFWLMALPVVR